MKKIALLALFFSAFAINAQSPTFRFGLTATPVFDWLRIEGDTYENGGTKFGFQYGLLFDQTIGNVERYAFSSGIMINYVNASITSTDTATDITSDVDLRVQYIEIPLTMRLRTNEVNYITYYGQFGLTPGFRIKARADYSYDGTVVDEDLDMTDKDNVSGATYNLMNISLTLGAGAEYALTENTSIMGGIFWQNGFANVLNDDIDDNNSYLKQIGVRLGVLF